MQYAFGQCEKRQRLKGNCNWFLLSIHKHFGLRTKPIAYKTHDLRRTLSKFPGDQNMTTYHTIKSGALTTDIKTRHNDEDANSNSYGMPDRTA